MKVGICAGFGEPIGAPALDWLQSLNFTVVRQGIDTSEYLEILRLVSEFHSRPITPLFVVGGNGEVSPDVIVRRAQLVEDAAISARIDSYAIEVINEPDLTSWSPTAFGTAISAVSSSCPLSTVVSGGISSTSKIALGYLSHAIPLIPSSVVIGVHTYRDTSPDTPLPGYSSRDQEFSSLRDISGSRRIWGTEVGWHDGRRSWWPCIRPLSGDEVARRLRREISLCASAGFEVVTIYQLNDGPKNPEERFGIRTISDVPKPSSQVALGVF